TRHSLKFVKRAREISAGAEPIREFSKLRSRLQRRESGSSVSEARPLGRATGPTTVLEKTRVPSLTVGLLTPHLEFNGERKCHNNHRRNQVRRRQKRKRFACRV